MISDPAAIRHGSVNVFVNFLQQITYDSDDRIRKLRNRQEKPAHRKKEYVEMDEKMERYLTEFDVFMIMIP